MHRFRFRLEKVRQWRQVELDLEEAALRRLLSELRALQAGLARVEADRGEAERALLRAEVVEAQELAALDAYRFHLTRERERIEKQIRECEGRIAAEQQRVLEARRKLRLLERLKERRRADWETETAREVEKLAGEVFLANWNRRGGR